MTTTTKHTPGPWRIRPVDYGVETRENFIQVLRVVSADGSKLISRLTEYSHAAATEEEKANARLIAAAPELLRALKEIAEIGGNLPDARLTNRSGPNDAAHRGLMYCQARSIARALLAEIEGAQ